MAIAFVSALTLPFAAHARNDYIMLNIQEALAAPDAKAKLGGDIQFHFGESNTPKNLERLGEDSTNRKTNAFNKSDEEACRWAFVSAIIALRDKAQRLGANAVVNIRSNNNQVQKYSATEFECRVGNVVAGVALKGQYAKVK